MKKWGKRQFGSRILAGMIVLAVCGCAGRIPQEKRAAIGSDYMEIYGGNTITRTGYFTNASGILYYVDFTTQDAIPVCNKPDCRHLSKAEDADTECDAAIDGARVFPYKGKLLGISEDSKGNEEIYSSDIDGSNRKVKKKLESSNMFINEGVIAKDSFFYVATMPEVDDQENMKWISVLKKLNLDTFEATQLDSVECKDALGFQLLGGTEEYQIYSLIKDDETLFYKLDYESCESEQIELFQSGYERILPEENENSFYYLSVEGGERNLYQYDIDSRKNKLCLENEKILENAGGDIVGSDLCGKCQEGIVYWVRTWTEEREEKMFLLDHNGKIQELSMPQQLPVAGTHFYDVICATEKGMYFWYLKDFESNGFQDNVDWQAYTEWEDLVNEKSVIKNVINPRMTAMGELVDENVNPINGQ